MKKAIDIAEAGRRYSIENPHSLHPDWTGSKSTFPEWAKNTGITKKRFFDLYNRAMGQHEKGLALTDKMRDELNFYLNAARDEVNLKPNGDAAYLYKHEKEHAEALRSPEKKTDISELPVEEGDKVKMINKFGQPDTFTYKGVNEKGNMEYQDHYTEEVPIFGEPVKREVLGIKKKGEGSFGLTAPETKTEKPKAQQTPDMFGHKNAMEGGISGGQEKLTPLETANRDAAEARAKADEEKRQGKLPEGDTSYDVMKQKNVDESAYPEKVKYITKLIESGGGGTPMSYEAAMDKLFKETKEKPGALQRVALGKVSSENVEEIRRTAKEKGRDIDVTGYTHTIDNSFINHALGEHDDIISEKSRGLVAITEKDISRIPEITSTPDKVEYLPETKKSKATVLYIKRINGEVYYYEEIREGRKELAAATLFKKRATLGEQMPQNETPLTQPDLLRGSSLDSTIPHPDEPVKGENEAAPLDQTKKDISDEQKRILGEGTKTEFVEGDVRKAHTPEEDEAALSKHGLTPDTVGEAVAVGSHKFDKDNLVHSIKLSMMSPEEMWATSLHEIGHGIQKTLDAMGRKTDKALLESAFKKEAKANGEAVSETIADKFRDYVLGKENAEPKGLVRRIFDRIMEFTEKLKNYLNDRGFKSVNDIFGEAYRGDLAKKDVVAPESKEMLYSKPDMNITRLDDRMFGDTIWTARKEAEKWAMKNLRDKSFVNKDTDWGIEVTGKNIKKIRSGDRISPFDHVEAIRAIPELIKKCCISRNTVR
ncbi:MAG: hypothetical protein L7F77_06700 [Candidatus Magnetominusculus sp. LBB02]|nr:hypothetical protein [Candidatus Magnetominusculus sp. LBB02]